MPPAMHHLVVAPRAIAPGAPRPRRARGGFGTGALSRPAPRPRLVRVASADDEPNATWDAESEQTGLSAQLRTTNALREKLSRALFDVDPSLVDEDVVYTSQVHEARGKRAYDELMREWKPLVKRNLQSFTYDAERAFCPEPGVLLVRWRAEWDGAFNADAAMVTFIEENFPEYDPTELARLRAEVEGADRTYSGDREYDVRGITTVRVNREGKVVMHSDRIVEKGEYLPWCFGELVEFGRGGRNVKRREGRRGRSRGEGRIRHHRVLQRAETAGRHRAEMVLRRAFGVGVAVLPETGRGRHHRDLGQRRVRQDDHHFTHHRGRVAERHNLLRRARVAHVAGGAAELWGGTSTTRSYSRRTRRTGSRPVKNGGAGSLPAAQAPALDADLLRSLWGAKIGL
jgi:hypothetical protein